MYFTVCIYSGKHYSHLTKVYNESFTRCIRQTGKLHYVKRACHTYTNQFHVNTYTYTFSLYTHISKIYSHAYMHLLTICQHINMHTLTAYKQAHTHSVQYLHTYTVMHTQVHPNAPTNLLIYSYIMQWPPTFLLFFDCSLQGWGSHLSFWLQVYPTNIAKPHVCCRNFARIVIRQRFSNNHGKKRQPKWQVENRESTCETILQNNGSILMVYTAVHTLD